MKTLSIIFLSLFVLMSCSTTDVAKIPIQKVLIEVQAVDPTKVTVEKQSINQSMEVNNPEGKLSGLSFIIEDRAFIQIYSGISTVDVKHLWNDLMYLKHKTTIKKVDFFINSPGGNAFAGLALADQIECAIRNGFEITAHASGIIASAAVPVFAACSKRLAAEGTIFMVHEASLWKWPGRETASDIRSQGELMDLLRDRYIGKLVSGSNLSKEEWETMEKETTWFSSEQAKEWGLVDEIE